MIEELSDAFSDWASRARKIDSRTFMEAIVLHALIDKLHPDFETISNMTGPERRELHGTIVAYAGAIAALTHLDRDELQKFIQTGKVE